jgi:WD40 repeat protein
LAGPGRGPGRQLPRPGRPTAGRAAAPGSRRSTIVLWDLSGGRKLADLDLPADAGDSLQLDAGWPVWFSPDARWLAARVKEGKALDPIQRLRGVPLPPDKWGLVLWSLPDGSRRQYLRLSSGPAAHAFGPGGRLLALGFEDGNVQLWDVESGKELFRWAAQTDSVRGLAFSPDGLALASAGAPSPTIQVLHLDKVRQELARIGLDW